VEVAGSSIAEHAHRTAQLTNVSALREIDMVFASPSFGEFAFVAGPRAELEPLAILPYYGLVG